MRALILAAGYATRLYPLTKDRPKPLLEVGGQPLVDWILDAIAEVAAIEEVHLVTNAKFAPAFRAWAPPQVVVHDVPLPPGAPSARPALPRGRQLAGSAGWLRGMAPGARAGLRLSLRGRVARHRGPRPAPARGRGREIVAKSARSRHQGGI